jgi:hypothetical protein
MSFLGFFAVSESLLTERPSSVGWFANLGSFRTPVVTADQVETTRQGFVSPRRYDFAAGRGISDHWPVLIDLIPRIDGRCHRIARYIGNTGLPPKPWKPRRAWVEHPVKNGLSACR